MARSGYLHALLLVPHVADLSDVRTDDEVAVFSAPDDKCLDILLFGQLLDDAVKLQHHRGRKLVHFFAGKVEGEHRDPVRANFIEEGCHGLSPLHDRCSALAAAYADGGKARAQAAALHFLQQGDDDAQAR